MATQQEVDAPSGIDIPLAPQATGMWAAFALTSIGRRVLGEYSAPVLMDRAHRDVLRARQYRSIPEEEPCFARAECYATAGRAYMHAKQHAAAVSCLQFAFAELDEVLARDEGVLGVKEHLAFSNVCQSLAHAYGATGAAEESQRIVQIGIDHAGFMQEQFGLEVTFMEDGSRSVHSILAAA